MRVVIDTVGVQTVYQLLKESVRIMRNILRIMMNILRIMRNMLSLTWSWVSSRT